jgi:P-type Cu2+ transporter
VDGGLSDYYRHREALPVPSSENPSSVLPDLGLFDHPEFQQAFVRPLEGNEREVDLILEGITCSACIWLNEQHIGRVQGVLGVQVNYTTRRARVRWDSTRARLSHILAAIAQIGYRAHPFDPSTAEQVANQERRSALWRLFIAGFGMMQVMMYAYPAYIAREGDMSLQAATVMRWASLILTVPVVFYSAAPFFQRAWRDLLLRRVGMDVPVALGIGSAFLASVWGTAFSGGEVYFDSVAMFVFFLLGGRYLEMLARQRAQRGMEMLGRVIPAFARRLAPDGTVEERVPASQLMPGDRILVRAGETIVADGLVLAGASDMDESWLTGESRPRSKTVGDEVLSGSLNKTQPVEVRVMKVGDSTRIATIKRLMERAANDRPKVVAVADKVAASFTSSVLILAAAAGLFWLHFDPTRAFGVFVSVLVVSCPCALSLATPAALTVAIDAFAKAGMLVTRGHAIETFASVSHFIFDKTGTLTLGRPRVLSVTSFSHFEQSEILRIAASLELLSEHPTAKAIVAAVEPVAAARSVSIIAGQGISGAVDGARYALGRMEFVLATTGIPLDLDVADEDGASAVYLGMKGLWIGRILLEDSLRPEAPDLISELKRRRYGLSIFSGDSFPAVQAVARRLGIGNAESGLSPEAKHAKLLFLQKECTVAMVGDGINDAPVLAAAHLSIAMSGGTELARNQADLVLLDDRLDWLLPGLALAKKTRRIIRQNLVWAFAYNVLSIPAAIAGWVTPWMAGIGMGASSVFVVVNALRIARVEKKDGIEWKRASIS